MTLQFSKYQGLGNDFVVVDGDPKAQFVARAAAAAICDRHLGVGADGVLLLTERDGAPRMQVINADGSTPEMCGNGLRCVALHLHRAGKVGDDFEVQTDAGPHRCEVLEGGRIRVAMPPASLRPEDLPMRRSSTAPVIDGAFEVAGHALELTAVSMGNPHAVVFDLPDAARLQAGPALSVHDDFPDGVNAGFATRRDATHFGLAVHERGVGWTRACGTGACAAAVAAVETGRAPRGQELSIDLPGGELLVRVDEAGAPVIMTGPAAYVFSGAYG